MSDRLLALLEAALFVSPEPLQVPQLARALGESPDQIAALANSLSAELAKPQHGLMLRIVAEGYQLVTKPEHHQELRDLLENLPPPAPLSRAAVETAAIIAYKQPITAAELESIRGVRNRETLRTLLKRKMIAPAGRARTRGYPVQYKTTKRFLIEFGLQSLDELPSLVELKPQQERMLDPNIASIERDQAQAALDRLEARAGKLKGRGFDWEALKADRDTGRP